MSYTLTRESVMPVPQEMLFDWHQRDGAFERLGPPWQELRVIARTGSIHDGDRIAIRLRQGPIWLAWDAVHQDFKPGVSFCDVSVRGPFPSWQHTHEMLPDPTSDSRSILRDTVKWRPPFGPIGRLMRGRLEADLNRLFAFRHARTAADLGFHQRYANQPSKTLLIAGWDNPLGRQACGFISTGGHTVLRLVGPSYQPITNSPFGGRFISFSASPALEPPGRAVRMTDKMLVDAATSQPVAQADGCIIVPQSRTTRSTKHDGELPLSHDGLPLHPDQGRGLGHLLRVISGLADAPRINVVLASESDPVDPEVVEGVNQVPVGDLKRRPRPKEAESGWTSVDRGIADALAAVIEG